MIGPRFKVGDKVRVLRSWAGLVSGDIATVHAIHSEDTTYQFVVLKEALASHPSHNFGTDRLEVYTPPIKADTQLGKVLALTNGQGSWTLAGIAAATGASEAAMSARLRELRTYGYDVTCEKPKGEAQRRYTVRAAAIALPA
jgi:biotin operon repressor